MGKRKQKKFVAMYKELNIKEERIQSYFIQEEDKEIFCPGNYLYKKVDDGDVVTFSTIFVQEVREYRENEDSPRKIENNVSFTKVDDRLFLEINEETIVELENANEKKIKKLVKRIISEIKWDLYFYSLEISEERERYLIDVYYSGDYDKFLLEENEVKEAWIKKINSIDFDLYQEINMHRFKDILSEIIERNNTLTNIDKFAIVSQCIDTLEAAFFAIEPNGKAKRQMDSYIGVDVDYKSKELIWGYTSPCEVRIEFCFFWSLIRNILSLTYVPAVLLLLDNKYKLIIYGLLMVVYLIALWFSDQKQTDKLLDTINKESKRIGYGTLYYRGLTISIVFLLFSIEMVIAPKGDLLSIIKYILIDVVGAYSIILIFNFILSMISWTMTKWSGTRFYRQSWKNIKTVLGKILITLVFVFGNIAAFDVLNIQRYFQAEGPELTLEFWIFFLLLMTGFVKILDIWMIRKKMNKDK